MDRNLEICFLEPIFIYVVKNRGQIIEMESTVLIIRSNILWRMQELQYNEK